MSNFKLIGLRPMAECHAKFHRVLKIGTIYSFFAYYRFLNENQTEIHSGEKEVMYIDKIDAKPLMLFQESQIRPNVEICGIVGKNGSGKSALIELLYAALYTVAVAKKYLYDIAHYKKEIEKISSNANVDDKTREQAVKNWQREIEEIISIFNSLKVEVYYEVAQEIRCLRVGSPAPKDRLIKTTTVLPDQSIQGFSFEHFFYSIVVNYSLYGLNSRAIGHWVEHLFHKNDGYQTPIVINPLRTEGNIDVNDETHLAQCRIVANLIDDHMIVKDLINGKSVEKISFEIDDNKLTEFGSINLNNVIDKFLKDHNLTYETALQVIVTKIRAHDHNDSNGYDFSKILFNEKITKYVIKKLFKIATYSDYKLDYYYIPEKGKPIPSIRNLNEYLKDLAKDRSHKTLKLRQIINTIYYDLLASDATKNIEWKNNRITIPVEELAIRVKNARGSFKSNVLEYIPGAFFRPTVVIKDQSTFNMMSSGEQQMINSIQTICYHLINLDSTFQSNPDSVQENKYRSINIILDEIELYFHVDFQRQFIHSLLQSLDRLRLRKIKNISLMFCTHSPFILSDIPGANILRLEDGNPYLHTGDETFAANINELLIDTFFLKNGLTGEFAKYRINSLVDFLTENKIIENNSLQDFKWDEKSALNFIRHIGEPLIRSELEQLYFDRFYDEQEIDKQIEELQKLKHRNAKR